MTMAYMTCIGYANAGQVLIAQAKAENMSFLTQDLICQGGDSAIPLKQ